MARTTHRLTAISVAALKRPGLHPDGGGLYLRITATETKGWIFRFTRRGATRDMGVGPYPAISLARARQEATEARRQLLSGADPIEARNARRAAAALAGAQSVTFKQCAEQLITAHELSWRNPKHRQQWRNTLKSYAYPIIGDVPVSAVDTERVLRILEPIWLEKPETASRLRGRVEAVLDWAKARGIRQGENAARWRGHLDHLLPARSKVRRVRHHPALPFDEIPAFMAELRALTSISARALEFTILTASRTNEALGARWLEFDIRRALWTVPGERMKGAREHRVPLGPRVLEIVAEMDGIRQNEFVFPGAKLGRPLSDMALLMQLRDMRAGTTVHGFRSAFKDWASEATSFPDHLSEAALAHTSADKVRAAYARSDLFEKRRKLMDAWSAYCERRAPAEVVPLRRQRS